MNQSGNGYEYSLKPLKWRFYIAALLLLVMTSAFIIQQRSHRQLVKTLDDLTRAVSGLSKVREASANRRSVLAAIQSQFARNIQNKSPEMILYEKIDELKTLFNADDMTITALEKKGSESSIQYTITLNNPDFNGVLNTISALHGSVFPVSPVSAIAITQSDVKGVGALSYKITGKIIANEKQKP
jgi:hypothetical protein